MGIDMSKLPAGPWRANWYTSARVWGVADGSMFRACVATCGHEETARLLAEAENVTRTTGLSPHELAAQVERLRTVIADAAHRCAVGGLPGLAADLCKALEV
jgi:hypothetical protein